MEPGLFIQLKPKVDGKWLCDQCFVDATAEGPGFPFVPKYPIAPLPDGCPGCPLCKPLEQAEREALLRRAFRG